MLNQPNNYYALLGLEMFEDSVGKIKEEFRRVMLKNHPDKNTGHRDVILQKCHKIIEAYKVLTDANLKKMYDECLRKEGKLLPAYYEQIMLKTSGKGVDCDIEYECEQCFGLNEVRVKIEPMTDFLVSCSHCGLRSRLNFSCD